MAKISDSYGDEINNEYNQDVTLKMDEISNTQDQYYLNYWQQKANNEREDTIRQEGYDREDNEKSSSDFINGMSAFTTEEAKAKYAEGRIKEKDCKFYLDGRELTANEVTRYKNALANLDQSTSSNASVGINGSGIETGSDGNLYVNGNKVELKDNFGYKYTDRVVSAYDSNGEYGETWVSDITSNMGVNFRGEVKQLDKLLKDKSYNDGTMFKLENNKGVYTFAIMKGGKLYYVKDGKTLWNNVGSKNQVYIKDSKIVSENN